MGGASGIKMHSLADTVAVVTGGSSGNGLEAAAQLAEAGVVRLVLVGRDRARGEVAVAAVSGRAPAADVRFAAADLTRPKTQPPGGGGDRRLRAGSTSWSTASAAMTSHVSSTTRHLGRSGASWNGTCAPCSMPAAPPGTGCVPSWRHHRQRRLGRSQARHPGETVSVPRWPA